jgi:N-acetylmuramoyl-L-alanine amidase
MPGRHDRQQELGIGLRRFNSLAAILLIICGCGFSAVCAQGKHTRTVVLDPGHTPNRPGALGVRGMHEVGYNDHFTAMLADALKSSGYSVIITREPDKNIDLLGRAAIANHAEPLLFLSIHHDSAQPKYLERITLSPAQEGYKTKKSIAGYSIFTSKLNPAFAESYRFAEMLGDNLLALKRPPSLHHAEPIEGEDRELLNRDLGIYRFDDLVVLKNTTAPAALLEVGVIVDEKDEAYIGDVHHQDILCKAIVAAIDAYAESN